MVQVPYLSPILKVKHDFNENTTTVITLTAQILVFQPRGQLGYLSSNLVVLVTICIDFGRSESLDPFTRICRLMLYSLISGQEEDRRVLPPAALVMIQLARL